MVDRFIERHNPELKRNFQGIDKEAVRALMALPWKGNVRELDNVIEHKLLDISLSSLYRKIEALEIA